MCGGNIMAGKKKPLIELEITEETRADLRGRQSVRTTFKLSERSIEALSVLAGQLGIKQKSLFDHLVQDTQALKTIAREFEAFSGHQQRIAKTYVVSRKSLESLEKVSMQYDTPRDALVEYSIERVLPLLAREKEKHHRRKQLLKELQDYLQRGAGLLHRAEEELGEDDPVFREMLTMMRGVKNCCQGVEQWVNKGRKIEKF